MPLSTHWGKNATPKLLRSFNDVRLKDTILVSHVDKVVSYSSISTIGKNATPQVAKVKQLAPSDPRDKVISYPLSQLLRLIRMLFPTSRVQACHPRFLSVRRTAISVTLDPCGSSWTYPSG
ncbi:hypothetical protein PoB_004574400 [Plakobranchus ocellatus]|uniref:Uncharacterized protein n=1 Tax=Plakobranchus ocellatus TaxID=259542 RepID=A0AAV4BJZ2_9GAST|nr:hypothetical protein PoB_004574400 [Plakobranchus ocellatus]